MSILQNKGEYKNQKQFKSLDAVVATTIILGLKMILKRQGFCTYEGSIYDIVMAILDQTDTIKLTLRFPPTSKLGLNA